MRVTVVVDAVDVVVTVETCDDAAVADLKAAVACEMDGDPNIALEGVVTKDGRSYATTKVYARMVSRRTMFCAS